MVKFRLSEYNTTGLTTKTLLTVKKKRLVCMLVPKEDLQGMTPTRDASGTVHHTRFKAPTADPRRMLGYANITTRPFTWNAEFV